MTPPLTNPFEERDFEDYEQQLAEIDRRIRQIEQEMNRTDNPHYYYKLPSTWKDVPIFTP